MTRQSVNYLIRAAARRAGPGALHPLLLQHSCGFHLANQGYDLRLIQDYLGHRDPKHTVHYTRVAGIPSLKSVQLDADGLGRLVYDATEMEAHHENRPCTRDRSRPGSEALVNTRNKDIP